MSSPDSYARETYDRFVLQVKNAKDHITRELGFDAWSIDLADSQQATGFLVPEDIFKKYELRDELTQYIKDIFHSYYIDVRMAEWRKESDMRMDAESEYIGQYCVNWCGSRHCQVELKHHLLLVFAPGNWAPGRHDVHLRISGSCIAPRLLYKWQVIENNDLPHYVRQRGVAD